MQQKLIEDLGKSERTIRGKSKMKKRITRRYLAGLMDGEGYISIRPEYLKGRGYYKPVIKMALTKKTAYILFEIKEMLGGHIHKREYANKNYNTAYCWEVQTFTAVKRVLDYIAPYLILKKEQAKIVNELIKTKIITNESNGTFTKIAPSVIEKRHCLYNLVKKLNKRGRLPAQTKHEPPTVKTEDEAIVRTSGKPEEVNGTETLTQQVLVTC